MHAHKRGWCAAEYTNVPLRSVNNYTMHQLMAICHAVQICESILETQLYSVCSSSRSLLVHRGISSFAAFMFYSVIDARYH